MSSIGNKLRAHPAMKKIFPKTMTREEYQAKEKDLNDLKFIGDCLLSDGWRKGILPLANKLMKQFEDLSDSDASTPEVAERSRQRRIGLKMFLKTIEDEVDRASKLDQELKREEKKP